MHFKFKYNVKDNDQDNLTKLCNFICQKDFLLFKAAAITFLVSFIQIYSMKATEILLIGKVSEKVHHIEFLTYYQVLLSSFCSIKFHGCKRETNNGILFVTVFNSCKYKSYPPSAHRLLFKQLLKKMP